MHVILKMIEDHTERIPMTVLEGNDREEELSNTQLFLIITGTCYAITSAVLFLTAWCNAKRAASIQERRNKKRGLNPYPIQGNVSNAASFPAGITSPSSLPSITQGNRVSPEQLLEDGIISETEINRGLVVQSPR